MARAVQSEQLGAWDLLCEHLAVCDREHGIGGAVDHRGRDRDGGQGLVGAVVGREDVVVSRRRDVTSTFEGLMSRCTTCF